MTRTNDSQPTEPNDETDAAAADTNAASETVETTAPSNESTETAATAAFDSESPLSYDAQATVPFDSNATVRLGDATPGSVPRGNASDAGQPAESDSNATVPFTAALPFNAASTGYATPNVPYDSAAPKKTATWYRKPVLLASVAGAVLLLAGAGIGFGIGATVGSDAELASNNFPISDGPGAGPHDDSAEGPGEGRSLGEYHPRSEDGPGKKGPRGIEGGAPPVAPTDAPTDAPAAPTEAPANS